jgi:hypothetical protein
MISDTPAAAVAQSISGPRNPQKTKNKKMIRISPSKTMIFKSRCTFQHRGAHHRLV